MDFFSFDINGLWGILSGLFGGTSIISFFLYRKTEKRLKDAEVRQKETEAEGGRFLMYEERLTHANSVIEDHNTTIAHQSQTIATLNDALDNKTQRIRELTDKLWESERESNQLNDKLVEKTERIGHLELQLAKYRDWHCRVADCPHRLPPNHKLKGKVFEEVKVVDKVKTVEEVKTVDIVKK